MEVKKLWISPDPEYQIVRAARICYNSEDESDSMWVPEGLKRGTTGGMTIEYPVMRVQLGPKDEVLLRKLVSKGHNMTLRFASAAFNISGISRACSHQLVRISHFGILQRSQRYVEESGSNLILGSNFPSEKWADKINNLHEQSLELYKEMVEDGVPQEEARRGLLEGTETTLNLSSNFQGWSHLFTIRLQPKVQRETYEVVKEIWRQLYEEAPIVFERFKGK